MATATSQDDLLDAIDKMTVLELSEFIKKFEERYGVTAAAPAAAAAAPAAGGGSTEAAAAPEEQTEFTATLTEIGPNKIPVIKVVRELTGLGLKEAKDVVDAAPKAVKEGITRDEADKIKAAIEEVGWKGRSQVAARPSLGAMAGVAGSRDRSRTLECARSRARRRLRQDRPERRFAVHGLRRALSISLGTSRRQRLAPLPRMGPFDNPAKCDILLLL